MTNHSRVAVILVNMDYAEKYLQACYASLMAQSYPASLFTVFIVNNGATEESKGATERIAPQARFLSNGTNRGWSAGNNTAIKVVLEEGFGYVVILSMDTVVEKDWLRYLVEEVDQRNDFHILQSKVLLYGTNKINSLGNRIHYLGYGYCGGYGQDSSTSQLPRSIDFASGTAMLVKREVFEKIGLLPEEYFMYYEDMEFCWRARLAGYNVGLAEKSICEHKYDFRKNFNYLYYFERNRLLTLLTLEKAGTILITAPCLILAEIFLGFYFIAMGWGDKWLKALLYFLNRETWKSIAVKRRQVDSLRTRKDAEIVRNFVGKIEFAEVDHPLLRYVLNPLLGLYWIFARTLILW